MNKLLTLIIVLGSLLIGFQSSFARSPAVDDFVGVETKDTNPTLVNQGTVFKFENTVKANQVTAKTSAPTYTSNFFTLGSILFFIFAPFVIWNFIIRFLDHENVRDELPTDETVHATAETSENVAYLDDHKKESEDITSHSDDDDIKKVS